MLNPRIDSFAAIRCFHIRAGNSGHIFRIIILVWVRVRVILVCDVTLVYAQLCRTGVKTGLVQTGAIRGSAR